MKRINLNLKTVLAAVALMACTSWAVAQEQQGQTRIKVIKNENGNVTTIDTTINEVDQEKVEDLLRKHNIQLNKEGDAHQVKVMEFVDEEGNAQEFTQEMKIIVVDEESDGNDFIFESEDGETHLLEDHNEFVFEGEDGAQKVEIKKTVDEDGNVTIQKWVNGEEVTEEIHFEGDHGHEHGTVKVIEVIDEDGNVTTNTWVSDEEVGEHHPNIEVLDGGSTFEFKGEDGATHTIDIEKEIDEDGNITFTTTVNGEEVEGEPTFIRKHNIKCDGENTFHVKGEDGENVRVRHEVKEVVVFISKISEEDKEQLEEPELKTLVEKQNLNDIDLTFSPNPNDGRFNLGFNLSKKGRTQINIVDMHGRSVYEEDLGKFSGPYSKNIDISAHGKGIYFIQIIQGNKATAQKIVIQ